MFLIHSLASLVVVRRLSRPIQHQSDFGKGDTIKKSQTPSFMCLGFYHVRLKGLEPSRRETLDPKSSASANSATSAYSVGKGTINN